MRFSFQKKVSLIRKNIRNQFRTVKNQLNEHNISCPFCPINFLTLIVSSPSLFPVAGSLLNRFESDFKPSRN